MFVFTLQGGQEDSHAEIKKLLPDHIISFTLLKLGYNKNESFDYRHLGKDLSLTARVEKESETKSKASNRSSLRELQFQSEVLGWEGSSDNLPCLFRSKAP